MDEWKQESLKDELQNALLDVFRHVETNTPRDASKDIRHHDVGLTTRIENGRIQVDIDISHYNAHHYSHMMQGLIRAIDPENEHFSFTKSKSFAPVVHKHLSLGIDAAHAEIMTEDLRNLANILRSKEGGRVYDEVSNYVHAANTAMPNANFYPHFEIQDGKLIPGVHAFTKKGSVVDSTLSQVPEIIKNNYTHAWIDYNTGQSHRGGVKFIADGEDAFVRASVKLERMEAAQAQAKSKRSWSLF